MNSNDIFVAKLGKAGGLQGHLRLFMDTDFPEQFKKGAVFKTNRKLELKVAEYNFSRELIKFENFDDLDTAKKLTNQELYSTFEQTKENCKLKKNTLAYKDYGETLIKERHRHRYEFNNAYRDILEKNGLIISGINPETGLVEIIELKDHPHFIASQFHPEFKSRPNRPHPLFTSFIKASIEFKN